MRRMDPKPLEDFSMWATAYGKLEPNIEALEDLVHQWMQMATQKSTGQRKGSKDLSWDNLERVKMGILCEAVALVLSGKLDELKDKGEP